MSERKNIKTILSSFLSATLIFALLVLGQGNVGAVEAKDDSINGILFCDVIPGATGEDAYKDFYKMATTDELSFLTRSISTFGGGVENVDFGSYYANALIQLGNAKTFKQVNEEILGYPLDESNVDSTGRKLNEQQIVNFNKSTAEVSPYDRFGLSGLTFTGYSGEWKYYLVDPCGSSKPSDPKLGVFYEGRLEPRSTWDDISSTLDVRTSQFSYSYPGSFGPAFKTSIANFVFGLTKATVAFTIALLGVSLSNVVELFGISGFLVGIFEGLYTGVFMPFIVTLMALVGLYILYQASRGREEEWKRAIPRVLATYALAVAASLYPSVAVELPNNLATLGQSVVVSSLVYGNNGKADVCYSEVEDSTAPTLVDYDGSKSIEEKSAEGLSFIEKSVTSLKSAVGCKIWKTLLLEPWSQGQFGTSWENLYANGFAPNGEGELGNKNSLMVGDASVPLGNGKTVNNWAIYHISTLTNAHADSSGENRPEVVNNVSTDWWRIVDALSNYDEVKVEKEHPDGRGKYTVSEVKVENKPSHYWDSWNGNSGWYRVWVSIMSLFIALATLIAPLLFGVKAASVTIGIAVLGATAPVFLLLGCFPGKGFRILEDYLKLLGNSVMSKIGYGLMLVLSLIVVSNALDLTGDYFTGLLLASFGSYVLYKGSGRIMAALKVFDSDSSLSAGGLMESLKERGRDVNRMAIAGVAGGVGASRNGISFKEGVYAGLKREALSLSYRSRSPFVNRARTVYHSQMANKTDIFEGASGLCSQCGKKIEFEEQSNGEQVFYGGMDENGELICNTCMQAEGGVDGAVEVWFHRGGENLRVFDEKKKKYYGKIYEKAFEGESTLSDDSFDSLIKLSGSENPTEEKIISALEGVLAKVGRDIEMYRGRDAEGRLVTPKIPKNLEGYIDKNALLLSYQTDRSDYVSAIYSSAILRYTKEELGLDAGISVDEATEFVHGVSEYGSAGVNLGVESRAEEVFSSDSGSANSFNREYGSRANEKPKE